MIVSAAVRIFDKRQNKEILIPCHRHGDAGVILKEFGYKIGEYKILEQGFLDENWDFHNRLESKQHALNCHQIETSEYNELYSEDLW